MWAISTNEKWKSLKKETADLVAWHIHIVRRGWVNRSQVFGLQKWVTKNKFLFDYRIFFNILLKKDGTEIQWDL